MARICYEFISEKPKLNFQKSRNIEGRTQDYHPCLIRCLVGMEIPGNIKGNSPILWSNPKQTGATYDFRSVPNIQVFLQAEVAGN